MGIIQCGDLSIVNDLLGKGRQTLIMARCCQWPADSEAALKESAKTWPTDSTSEENECSLESWLVKNGTANRSIFERIFTKVIGCWHSMAA